MKTVSELLEGLQYEVIKGDTDRTVSDLVCNTRKVTEGCLFVCVKGASYDSHEHVDEIVQKGAAAVVAERPVAVPDQVTLILVAVLYLGQELYAILFIRDNVANLMHIIGGVCGNYVGIAVAYLIRMITGA